jgi:transcriptional regulator with XRE-family HTH domain
MDISNVTVLKHADGSAQHAILPWQDYQALLRAAGGHGLQPPIPAEVRQAIADGIHPVRAWREQRGLNQGQLAAMVGISRAYLAQIEGGERTGTLEVMARVARALDRPLEDLIAAGPDNFANAAAGLGAMPARLKEIAAALPQAAWRTKPAGGGFSLVEHVCHLRDIDGDGYRVRLERMLTESNPSLPDLDGDALAKERAYQSADMAAALGSFTATRLAIVARLAKVSPEERRRTGLMAGKTEITLDGLVDMIKTHDSEHLDQLGDLQTELAR